MSEITKPTLRISDLISEYKEYLTLHRKPDTVKNYLHTLEKFIKIMGDIDVDNLSLKLIEKFASQLCKYGYSSRTIRRHLFAIKNFCEVMNLDVDFKKFDWQIVDGKGNEQAREEKKDKELRREIKIMRVIPEELVKEIIEKAKTYEYQFYIMLKLGYEAALRSSELCYLKWNNVDWHNRRILIIPLKKKTPEIVGIPISQELIEELAEYNRWLRSKGYKGLWVFPTPYGELVEKKWQFLGFVDRPRSPSWFAVKFSKFVFENFGIRIRYHDFARHSRATNELRKGVDLFKVHRLLRHTNLNNTAIYLKLTDKDLEELVVKWGDNK